MSSELDAQRMPAHVAIVMDGNGRWGQQRGLKRTEGHAAGEEALFDTVDGALDIGLRWLTVFAFSTENWRRPLDEVRFLMNFNERLLLERRDDLNERGVRVRFIGRRGGRVPRRVRRRIEETEALTAANRRLTLTFAFNYGGRAEIVDTCNRIMALLREREMSDAVIDEQFFGDHLYTANIDDPDLLIRTSGELRVSNFLLWQIAYAEIHVNKVLWPDFRRRHLFEAIIDFQSRERRYGGVDESDAEMFIEAERES